MKYKAVIFDLDGVLCFTDEYHYRAWKAMADEIGVPFDRKVNDKLRGVSRMESLEIILAESGKAFSEEEKTELAQRKNGYYRQMLQQMSPADLPAEVKQTLEILKERGYLVAVGSSSKNAAFILKQIGLERFFHVVVDGNCIEKSKPDPEVFLTAAQRLHLRPDECLVVEDAVAGAEAAHRGGMLAACVGDASAKQVGEYNLSAISELIDILPERQECRFAKIAEALKPLIYHRKVEPKIEERLLQTGDSFTVDFGEHLVGRIDFKLSYRGSRPDAPVWLQINFAERLCELDEKLEEYHGFVSPAWVQQEQLHVDELPMTIQLPRRYAFRYMCIQVLALSGKGSLIVENVACDAVTSADEKKMKAYNGPKDLERLDNIACRTLRDCMQEVFEDGPKRDRRLWLGDLRLQALVNYETYQHKDLVKRCLYLFAACPLPDGHVASSLYIKPKLENDGGTSFDYSLLFVPTLYDYYCATDDLQTVCDLWETAWRQIELASAQFDENDLVISPEEMGWCFIDWSFVLDRQASAQGVYLYCLRSAEKLAERLNDRDRLYVIQKEYTAKKAAARNLLDSETGVFVSGKSRQVSWASQIWMIMGGVLNKNEAQHTLANIEKYGNAVPMVTPYLVHHYVEALIQSDMPEKALEILCGYWGGMAAQGADTFWEMFDPKVANLAPYGGTIVNSYCHAWSCGPAYFLRKYTDRFSLAGEAYATK